MGNITLSCADGFTLSAYEAKTEGEYLGAVVVIQEVFGVNSHIRAVADGYAAAGYYALAPALFDRVATNVELGYADSDVSRGVDIAFNQLQMRQTLADIQVAIERASEFGEVGMVGYCYGGLMTWLSACQLKNLSAASAYYGGGIPGQAGLTPQCPIILHFGEQDAHIPMDTIREFIAAHPDLAVHIYDADHGFNCDQRASFNPEAAALAKQRTLELFNAHLRR